MVSGAGKLEPGVPDGHWATTPFFVDIEASADRVATPYVRTGNEQPGGDRTVGFRTETIRIEAIRVGVAACDAPLMVFLHEGLGSVSMWRDFPARLCERAGCRGLVYSRPGYGKSTPPARDAHWTPDYMHREALGVLPAVLDALGIDCRSEPVWLVGHSDGGSIALIHAAHFPERVAGAVLLAPHIVVEDLTVSSIRQARQAFLEGNLRSGLARHHRDVEATFLRWNRIWLSAEFRDWSIENEAAAVRCPLLVVQGNEDPYGTLEQVSGIERRVPGTRIVHLPDCGHSPHRDQPERLIAEVVSFVDSARTRQPFLEE